MNEEKKRVYKDTCKAVIKKIKSEKKVLAGDYERVDTIFDYYEQYKEYIHGRMLYDDKKARAEIRMDSHKMAAAFFCSFLKAKPLSYVPDGSGTLPDFQVRWANVHGAFLFGLQVVQDFWNEKCEDDISALDREIYKNPIKVPKTDMDSYFHWFIKLVDDDIAPYLDLENEKFEGNLVFFIAHLYFLLEEFAYQYYKATLYENDNERLNQVLK